jgi:hypothetical protein
MVRMRGGAEFAPIVEPLEFRRMLSDVPLVGDTGQLSLSPGSIQDSFTFVARDGRQQSAQATVNVTIVALAGDANMDGRVNMIDLAMVAGNYGKSNMSWRQGDFTGDHRVDLKDLVIISGTYGSSIPLRLVAATEAFVPASTLDSLMNQLDLPELDAALPR